MHSTKILQQLSFPKQNTLPRYTNLYPVHGNLIWKNHFFKKPNPLAASFPKRNLSSLNGLPFKISREKADASLSNYHRFLEASNTGNYSTALTLYKGEAVKECFVPFHSAHIVGLSSNYVGEYGNDRTEVYLVPGAKGPELRTHIVTDWYRCAGTLPTTDYPFGTLNTQIYAGFEYPREIVERALSSNHVKYIEPLTSDKFNGSQKIVYPHEMNMGFALEKLNSRLYDNEHARALQHIIRQHRADHSRIHTLDMNLAESQVDLCSYHIPAYIYTSKILDFESYKIVNAYSGNIHGNKIYSILKSSMFGAGFGAALTWGLVAFTNPYLRISQILFRMAIGSSLSGVLSGTTAYTFNSYKNASFKTEKDNEKEKNKYFSESDEDQERKRIAMEMNGKQSCFSKNNIYLPIDKCKLLGINPEEDITLEKLRKAYHAQIRKWHPDFFRETNARKIAEEMSKQINEANKELTDILLHHQPKKL